VDGKTDMSQRKYEKYIVTQLKENLGTTAWHGLVPPAGKGKGGRILYMDSEVIPEAHYCEALWLLPGIHDDTEEGGNRRKRGVAAHTHDYDEILAYFGTNLEDPHDLGAEIEFWLEDERYILTKSCMIFIPAHIQHCPLRILSISRPIFHFSTSPLKKYF
jgi:hypothetical protein